MKKTIASENKNIEKETTTSKRIAKKTLLFLALSVGLVVISILSLRFGSVAYSTAEIIDALFSTEDSNVRTIVMNVRFPRLILAILVGANLAMSGALLQAVMRNPLADPGLTGVSTGAALAAITIMLVFPVLGAFVPLAAFIGGCIATLIVFSLAWQKGVDPIRIILAGVAVNAVLGGGTALLVLLHSDRIQGALMWLNGSIAGRSWHHVDILLPYSILGLVIALLCINPANMLQLGDDAATNLGLRVNLSRIVLSATAAFLAGISISVVGLVGFIGLIVPHISRLLFGSNYSFMLPASAVIGAILLLIADIAARTILSPIELPVGIIMAVVGGPFFLYLLRSLRKGRSYKV